MSSIDPTEARKLVASKEVEVIDLRDADGWRDGHIPGAHRAADDLDGIVDSLEADRRLLIVCENGDRSAEVAKELSEGDREAVSLKGGMSKWLSDGLPAAPSDDYTPPSSTDGDDRTAADAGASGSEQEPA